jgi:hypothetical protein
VVASRLTYPIVIAAAFVALDATVTTGGKPKPPRCDGGRFLLEQPLLGTSPEVIVIAGRSVMIQGLCPATAAKLTTTRKGTQMRGAWPACGTLRKVRITARFDATCTGLRGVLRAKKRRHPVSARRSTCGDGVVDDGAGEGCEPPGSAGCDPRCRVVSPTTTTVVNATTTSTSVAASTATPVSTSTTTTTVAKLDVWRPTTVPWDPECRTGCVAIARTAPLAHADAELLLRVNPAVDDPIAQWGDCLESILACLERDGGRLAPCVDEAACPAECKALFRTQAAGATDEEARADAFEAVFVHRTAPCRPSAGGAP